jgi:hypothetical protein
MALAGACVRGRRARARPHRPEATAVPGPASPAA